jgi:hypothetical protein
MKKRGQLILKPTVELIVAITIFLLFIYVGKTWGNGEVFQKARAAKESALIIDAMYATEGNAYITYPVNLSKYIIKFSSGNVLVSSAKTQPDQTEVSYSFIPIGNYVLNREVIKPNRIVFAKLGKEYSILDKEPNLNKVDYQETSATSPTKSKKVLLDIDESTLSDPNKLPKAQILVQSLNTQIPNSYLTARAQSKQTSGPVINEADILIIIRIGEYGDQRNIIKAYYPVGNTRLASMIINELVDKELNLDGANIIPTDSILTNSNLAVLLEIGNINSKEGLNMIASKAPYIAEAVYNAINKY